MKNIKNLIIAITVLLALNVKAQDKTINAAELPLSARTFLMQHFKDNAVVRATVDQEVRRQTFEVTLTDGTEIEFTENGDWKEVDGQNRGIPTAFLVNEVSNYVTKQYPAEKVVKASRSSREIEIELSNGLELEFNRVGKFKRIDR